MKNYMSVYNGESKYFGTESEFIEHAKNVKRIIKSGQTAKFFAKDLFGSWTPIKTYTHK